VTQGLSETHLALRDAARRFAEAEVAPLATDLDETERFPSELYARLAEAGLFGIAGAGGEIGQGTPAPLGHDQDMDRCLGVDVVEGQKFIVFKHFARRDLAGDDLAKEAVGVSGVGH
jgi:hypothetical protein